MGSVPAFPLRVICLAESLKNIWTQRSAVPVVLAGASIGKLLAARAAG